MWFAHIIEFAPELSVFVKTLRTMGNPLQLLIKMYSISMWNLFSKDQISFVDTSFIYTEYLNPNERGLRKCLIQLIIITVTHVHLSDTGN